MAPSSFALVVAIAAALAASVAAATAAQIATVPRVNLTAAADPCLAAVRPSSCRVVCGFTSLMLFEISPQVVGTVAAYRARLDPALQFRSLLIPIALPDIDGEPSKRATVLAWEANNGAALCDAVVGTGISDIDEALVGAVRVPWLEPVVSNAAMTSRLEFPDVLNVLPRQADIVYRLLHAFPGIGTWSILSDASPGSRGWRTAAEAALNKGNRTLDVLRELSVTPTEAQVDTAIEAVLAVRTRYVFIAMDAFAPAIESVIKKLAAKGASARRVLVFVDVVCMLNSAAELPGAVCNGYDSHGERAAGAMGGAGPTALLGQGFQNLTHYWATLDAVAPEIRRVHAWANITLPDSSLRRLDGLDWGAMFHDAVLHYMLVANATPATKPTYAQLRAAASAGASGPVSFGADGVRRDLPVTLRNVQPNKTTATVGISHVGSTSFDATHLLYLMGQHRALSDLPAALDPLPPASTSNTTLIIALVAGGVVLIIAAIAGAFAVKSICFTPDPRNNRYAPKDESQPFSIAFTDIQASTTLWAVAPQGMSEAVEQHHALVRELIADHKGYEVKTIGDSFMVAFQDAAAAVRFAVRLQGALYHAEWPADIDRAYEAMAAEAGLGAGATDAGLWSGLRVRVGVHHGSGSIVLDPTTKGYDYYGTVVNTAARVETVGNGGQVLVTAAALAAAGDDAVEDAVVAGLGAQQLRGLNDAVELHQVVPAEFDGRQFPPLRLDRIDDDDCQLALDPTADVRPSESVADGNTSSSQPSSRKKAAGGGRTDSGTDKGTGQGSGTSTVIDDPHTLFLRTVLSPLSVSDRGSVLATLVGKWHVNVGTAASARALAKPAVSDKALVAVATRAARALTALNHTALPGSQKDSTSRFGESTAETGEDRHAGSFRLGHHNYSGNSILRASQGRFGRAGTMRSGAYLAGQQPSPDHADLGRRDSQCSGGPSGGGTSGLGFGSALGSSAMMNIVLDGTGSNAAVASATPMSLRSPNMESQRRGAQGAAFPGHLSASLTMQSASWGGDQVTSAGSSAVVSPSRGRGGAGDPNRGGRGQGSSPPLVGLSAPVGTIPVGSDFGSAAQSFEIPGKTDSSGAGSSPETGPSPNPGHSTATDLPLPPLPPSHPGSSHDVTEQ